MSCEHVNDLIPSLLDGRMPAGEEGNALAHLESCRACNIEFQSIRNLRRALRTMDHAAMPEGLQDKLRVLASHERERQIHHVSFSARVRNWADHLLLAFDNMMRPIALPFAGGLVTAMLLLGVWVPTLGPSPKANPHDVPLPYWVYAQPLPLQAYPEMDGLVVELTIDERGEVVDYDVLRGQMTPELNRWLLSARFDPKTVLGQPRTSKLVYGTISVRG